MYRLSKLIPVRMHSTYGVYPGPTWDGAPPADAKPTRTEHARWWQWRGRIMGLRVQVLA